MIYYDYFLLLILARPLSQPSLSQPFALSQPFRNPFRILAWQEGQNPRVRQENMTNRSSPQSGHRIRANPQRELPQSR